MKEMSDSANSDALAAVKETAGRWLLFPDGGLAVEVLLAAVIANRLDGDPFWLFLVNPPGGAKTELIRGLSAVPEIYPLSSLTPRTLVSGLEAKAGREPSLLPKLNGKILTLKDFTTVLTMRREDRAEILSQLREIYDGHYRKDFGTGKSLNWTGKVGLIAGVTEVIDTYYSVNQVLGERFLLFRLGSQDGLLVAKKAIENQGHEKEMRQAIQEVLTAFLSQIDLTTMPTLPDPILEKLIHLATFCVTARSGVLRDSSGEIDYIPGPEGPARLAKQLVLFCKALVMVHGSAIVGEEEYRVAYRLAWDTIPGQKRRLLEILSQDNLGRSIRQIAKMTGYSYATARRYLQELGAMGLLVETGEGQAAVWQMSEKCRNWLQLAKPETDPEVSPLAIPQAAWFSLEQPQLVHH
jgi:predicted transcriptional regulator